MELYGSLLNISGSVTASTFTGSFIGDGSGLTGIQASGVVGLNLSQIATGSVSASLSPDGFNVNTDTSITGALNISGSVNITGSISLNGEPIGTGKLDETTFQSYTSSNDDRVLALETTSGSLNSFTSSINTTIKSKLDTEGVISGSVQVNITGTTGYSTFSSSLSSSVGSLSASIATTDLNQENRLDTIESNYATTGSNLFIGTQTHSGSIIPSVDNEYDLGSITHQWRDVYISSGSLYIDGTKVISSTTQELQITTDNGQSIKILEGGTDSIILQTADGDIELKSNADGDILLDPTNGKIMLKGPVEILNGQKIQSSVGGTPVVFANDIVVSGSIELTGTVDGIDLIAFSSSVNNRLTNLETTTGSLNSFTSSASDRLTSIETSTSSLNAFTNSINTTIKSKLDNDGVVSSSVQIVLSGTTGFSTVSASLSSLSSSISNTDFLQDGRLGSLESKTGSYATTGSNNFNGNQTITGSLVITQNLQVLGSSSIVYTTASQLIVEDNKIVLNASFPAERFSGIEVHDSGSNGAVTASLFWDGLNNRWIYQNSSEANYGGAMFIAGPRNTGSLGDEPSLTSGKLPKSIGGDHIGDSIITETNGGIGISGSLVITGSIQSTVTALVSGSSQITYGGLTGIPSGIVSGSEQVKSLLPTGTVSGSSQVLNGSGIWSGSAQLPSGIVSGSAQVSFSGIVDKPTLVSGSSQISFTGLSGIPGGLVSGSSQIDLTETTNYSSGILTRLNAVGVFSGSAQVTGISNSQLTNSSFHVGTTSISLGRSSAAQTLTGVSIDGNSATVGGFTPSQTSGTANRVVVADANGYIVNNYFNASGGGAERNASGMSYFAGHNSSDYYYRSYTAAAAAALLSGQSMNINGTATNITAYTINQNVGSSNSPTFSGLDLTGRLYLNGGAYEGSILFGSATTWRCGIRQHDDADAELRIWTVNNNGMIFLANGYNGEPADIARPTDGLVVGPGNNVGIGNFSSSDPGYKLQVNGTGYFSGNLSTAAYVLIGGSYGDNAYTSVNSTRLLFGGGNSDAVENYYIGTNKEDYGGNYTKLDLRWHTGIRMGAQAGYGGIRFYDSEDLGTVLFSIGASDGNVRSHTNLIPSSNNSYNLGSATLGWANVYTNDLHLSNMNKPEGNDIDGTRGTWTIQEGAENLYIINNNNGKKFKINLEEIL